MEVGFSPASSFAAAVQPRRDERAETNTVVGEKSPSLTMSALSSSFSSVLTRALRGARHFALVEQVL